MTNPPPNAATQAATRAAINTAFDITDLLGKDPTPFVNEATYAMLLDLLTQHGPGALAAAWMIWARTIALGLRDKGLPPTALFPNADGSPDLRYARNAVAVARDLNPEAMVELVDAMIRDQQRQRSGASIPGTSAVLALGAVRYGKPTTRSAWTPPDHS